MAMRPALRPPGAIAPGGLGGQAAARERAWRFARAIAAHHRIQCPGRPTHLEVMPGRGAVRAPGCGCARERLLFAQLAAAQAEGWPARPGECPECGQAPVLHNGGPHCPRCGWRQVPDRGFSQGG